MRITLNDLQGIAPQQFEKLVARLLEVAGFDNVLAIGGSGDEGIDLRAEWMEDLPTGDRRRTIWAVQCKRYTRAVSETEVRTIINSALEPPEDLMPKHPDFFLIATSSRLSVNAQRVLNRANSSQAKYGCHFLVWNGDHLVDRINSVQRLIEEFFQRAGARESSHEPICRLQVIFDEVDDEAVLTFSFEDDRCLMGTTRVPAATLERLITSFRGFPLWGPTESEVVATELQRLGTEIFSLIPTNIQRALRQNSRPLRLTSNIHMLPFELAWDPDNRKFLGSTHQVGRIHFADSIAPPRMPATSVSALFVSPEYFGDIPALRYAEDVLGMISTLGLQSSARSLTGREATIAALSERIQQSETPQILHFSGHGISEDDEVALVMSDGPVRAREVLEMLPDSSMVFLNACSTGSALENLSRYLSNRQNTVLVGFVGPVTDVGGACLAEEFYRRIFSGDPLGQAVQSAREHQRVVMPNDYSWISLVLFGDPLARIDV